MINNSDYIANRFFFSNNTYYFVKKRLKNNLYLYDYFDIEYFTKDEYNVVNKYISCAVDSVGEMDIELMKDLEITEEKYNEVAKEFKLIIADLWGNKRYVMFEKNFN